MRNFLSFHGFEPSFVDQTSVMHTRGAACGATRRGAALLENFGVKSRLHTSFLSQNSMGSMHNMCRRSILVEICP